MPGTKLVKLAALAAGLTVMPAMAAVETWEHQMWDLQRPANNNLLGNVIQWTGDDGINLRMTGWSTDGPPSDTGVRKARMVNYDTSGLAHWGIRNCDEGCQVGDSVGSPDHAVDNGDGNNDDYDFFLMEFSEAVNLTQVAIDWKGQDSDISVAAFNSNPVTVAEAGGKTLAQLLTDAGAFFKNSYSNISVGTYTSIDTGTNEAKYWLVSAYSPVVSNKGWTEGNDALKFSGWKTRTLLRDDDDVPGVPSPGSLALLLAGVLVMRANRARAATLTA